MARASRVGRGAGAPERGCRPPPRPVARAPRCLPAGGLATTCGRPGPWAGPGGHPVQRRILEEVRGVTGAGHDDGVSDPEPLQGSGLRVQVRLDPSAGGLREEVGDVQDVQASATGGVGRRDQLGGGRRWHGRTSRRDVAIPLPAMSPSRNACIRICDGRCRGLARLGSWPSASSASGPKAPRLDGLHLRRRHPAPRPSRTIPARRPLHW